MKNKKIIYMLLAFIVPIFMFLLVMYLRVGEIDGNYILIADMGSQYNSLFQYFKNVLNGTESLFYSFHKGLGGEMFTTFTYYLSSPLNLLVFFFKDGQIPNCILLIILIKIGLSGLTMNIYLNNKNPNKLNINFIFSMCYALMAYTVNYYFNIMWLDAVYMLPIVILGLEKLINKNKPLLYIIALSYTIICNYYMGYMVCLFSLLYFIYQMILQNKKDKQTIIIFIISSILSAGIASFILIPTAIELGKLSGTDGLEVKTGELLIGLLKNIFNSSHTFLDISNASGTYTYTTSSCIFLITLFMINKSISKKEKIVSLIIIIFFLISFIFNPLRYIWHGFSYPNFLNNRNSFLFCFFVITISVKSFSCLQVNKSILFKSMLLYSLFFCICVYVLKDINTNSIIITACILFIQMILIYNIGNYHKKVFNYLFYSCVIFELFFNLFNGFISKTIISESFQAYKKDVCQLTKNNNYNNFHRIENRIDINGIDGLTCGYSNISIFLSTLTKDDIQFFSKTGYITTGKEVFNNLNNVSIFDSFLGIKYYILEKNENKYNLEINNKCADIGRYDNEKQLVFDQKYCIYENPFNTNLLSLVQNIEIQYFENIFDNQNNILKSVLNSNDEILNSLKIELVSKNTYKVYNYGKKFYLYMRSSDFKKYNERTEYTHDINPIIYVNKKKFSDKLDKKAIINSVVFVDSSTDVTEIKIENFDNMVIDNVYASTIDENLDNITFDTLKQNVIIDKTSIEGTVQTEKKGYLLITIPYNKNFELYIDNEKVEIEKAYDYFMSTKISGGKHRFKLVYNKNIYYTSTVSSILFILLTLIFTNKLNKNKIYM